MNNRIYRHKGTKARSFTRDFSLVISYLCPNLFLPIANGQWPKAFKQFNDSTIQQDIPPPPYGKLMRCHIIDLSPYTDLHPGTYLPCKRALWLEEHPHSDCTSGNVYYNNCHNYIPHSHYD
jgi:hypothetical protein